MRQRVGTGRNAIAQGRRSAALDFEALERFRAPTGQILSPADCQAPPSSSPPFGVGVEVGVGVGVGIGIRFWALAGRRSSRTDS